jgi:hypothetical protein
LIISPTHSPEIQTPWPQKFLRRPPAGGLPRATVRSSSVTLAA